MLCSICNKNTAVIFINKQDETGKQELQGLCYECAKAKGINPIDSLMKQANLSENDLNDMTKQLETIVKDMANNIDLSKSYAYGDTTGDFTMFKQVGNAVAINPARRLLLKIKKDKEIIKLTVRPNGEIIKAK